MKTRDGFHNGEFELFDQDGKVGRVLDAIPTRLSPKQTTGRPAESLVTVAPTLHVAANFLDDGEGRLEDVGAGEFRAKLVWNA